MTALKCIVNFEMQAVPYGKIIQGKLRREVKLGKNSRANLFKSFVTSRTS